MGDAKMTAEERIRTELGAYHTHLSGIKIGGELAAVLMDVHAAAAVAAALDAAENYHGDKQLDGENQMLLVLRKAEARVAEVEKERDAERDRAVCARASEARRIDERNVAYTALTVAAAALAANDFDLARDVLCRSSARDKAADLRRADMKDALVAIARAEKAEALVAEVVKERDEAIAECDEADQCFEDIATALRCGKTGGADAGCDCSLKSPLVLAIEWRSRAEIAQARVAELEAEVERLMSILRGAHTERCDDGTWVQTLTFAPQAPPARKEGE